MKGYLVVGVLLAFASANAWAQDGEQASAGTSDSPTQGERIQQLGEDYQRVGERMIEVGKRLRELEELIAQTQSWAENLEKLTGDANLAGVEMNLVDLLELLAPLAQPQEP